MSQQTDLAYREIERFRADHNVLQVCCTDGVNPLNGRMVLPDIQQLTLEMQIPQAESVQVVHYSKFHGGIQFLEIAHRFTQDARLLYNVLAFLLGLCMSAYLLIEHFAMREPDSLTYAFMSAFVGGYLCVLILALLLTMFLGWRCHLAARNAATDLFYVKRRQPVAAQERLMDLLRRNPLVYARWGSRIDTLER